MLRLTRRDVTRLRLNRKEPSTVGLVAGPSQLTCREGLICVDNPGDNCNPTQDGFKCPGTCKVNIVKEDEINRPCGGTTGYNCSGGMICVDDPSDNCNPTKDGAKCKG